MINQQLQEILIQDVACSVKTACQFIEEVAKNYERPCVLFKPKISMDGNMWCALYGENLQDGVAGFGITPNAAMRDFDKNWLWTKEQIKNASADK